MAFRGYELNLMLRVQDRGTTRLRRVAQDLGGINRAAQMQRDMARLITQATTAQAQIEKGAARDRLRGLKESEVAARAFNKQLRYGVEIQQLSVAEANRLAVAYERAVAAQRMATIGRSVSHISAVGAMAGGVGLLFAGGVSASFANFNRETVKAATQLRGVNEPLSATVKISSALSKNILDLTQRFPSSAAEMAQGAYEIASGMDLAGNSTQRFNETSRLLEYANKISVAGFTDLESATNTLVTVLNNFDPQARNVDNVLNTLFATVRFGRGDFTQFADLFGPVASGAKAASQDLTQAGGALAFLTTRLPRPQAASGLQRLYQILGTKTFIAGFESIFKIPETVTENGVTRLKQLSDIIGIIVAEAPQLASPKGSVELMNLIQTITARGQFELTGRQGQGLQGTIQARRALFNLIQGSRQYADVLQNVKSDTTEFSTSLAAAMQTPGVRWQIAINQFKAFAIIVGQDVLPVMLRFMQFLANIAHHFENLSPGVRHAIAEFTTWGSIILFLGGGIGILVGGIISLAARMGGLLKILGVGGEAGLIGRFVTLSTIVRYLASVGAIVISIKLIQQGGSSALFGLLMAAFAGYQVGGPIGAIVIPVVLELSVGGGAQKISNWFDKHVGKYTNMFSEKVLGDSSDAQFLLATRSRQQDLKRAKDLAKTFDPTKEFTMGGMLDLPLTKSLQHVTDANTKTTRTILQQWQDLASQLTGLDVFGSLSQAAAAGATQLQLNLAKAQAEGDNAAIRKALQAQLAFDRQQIKHIQGMKTSAEHRKQLIQLYADEKRMKDALASLDKKAENASTKAENAANKLANAQSRVAAAELRIQQLREQSLQQLQSAFGQIFQGPIMQGPIGQAFQQISSTLSGFGQIFKIPVTLTLGDQAAQQRMFDRLVDDINWLFKRGKFSKVDWAAISEQLLQGGAGTLAELEGIRAGTPAQQRQFIENLKKRQSSIGAAASSPWNKQLQAAQTQLKAAQIQLQAAKRAEAKASKDAKSAPKKDAGTKPASTPRKTASSDRTLAGYRIEIGLPTV